MTGAVGGVLRQLPPAVVKPLIMATEATSNVLGGMRNQIHPDARQEESQKWRQGEEWILSAFGNWNDCAKAASTKSVAAFLQSIVVVEHLQSASAAPVYIQYCSSRGDLSYSDSACVSSSVPSQCLHGYQHCQTLHFNQRDVYRGMS